MMHTRAERLMLPYRQLHAAQRLALLALNYNLKKKEYSDISCLLITAVVFSVVHLTNLAGQSFATVALQTVYSFVIGLALAAVYLKNKSIVQVIAAHFLIGFTNRIYMEQAGAAAVGSKGP